MENEQVLQNFEEIEQKIEKLIGICKSLEDDNSQLINEIERLEQEIEEKADAEKRHVAEKGIIRSRIDNLLVKLKDVEQLK